MYEGAALLHSKKNFVEACLKESTESVTAYPMGRDTTKYQVLADHPNFVVRAEPDEHGMVFDMSHQRKYAADYVMKTIKTCTQPMAFVVKQDVRFNLPRDFEATGQAKYSWQELERDFGITKDLFDVHSVMTDDPTVALQGAYKAVHSQEVHETYHMDFSESD